mmetsp:Transcript_38597/g.81920  ORF Transcript_38597/g.81920 Transcript_38597/m.81920 type:complete len:85 (-) Transcript_38597:1526-1780(-)
MCANSKEQLLPDVHCAAPSVSCNASALHDSCRSPSGMPFQASISIRAWPARRSTMHLVFPLKDGKHEKMIGGKLSGKKIDQICC